MLVKPELYGSRARIVISGDVVGDFSKRPMNGLQVRDRRLLLLRLGQVNLRPDLAPVENRLQQLRKNRKEAEWSVKEPRHRIERGERRRQIRVIVVRLLPADGSGGAERDRRVEQLAC